RASHGPRQGHARGTGACPRAGSQSGAAFGCTRGAARPALATWRPPVRPAEATLTDWPAPVMMKRCEADPLAQLMRELERLEVAVDGLASIDDEDMPPTDKDPRVWGVG